MHHRGEDYRRVEQRIAEEYRRGSWRYATRWMNKVGLRRLVAQEAAATAGELLNDVNASTHRNEPETADLLVAAREAVQAYVIAVTRENWRRFNEGRVD